MNFSYFWEYSVLKCKWLIASAGLLSGLMLTIPVIAADPVETAVKAEPAQQENPVVIEVNGKPIYRQQYQSFLRSSMRNSFYHMKIPEENQKNFPMDTADKMINQYLMIEDLKNQPVQADMELVKKQQQAEVDKIDKQYKDNKSWQENKEQYSKVLLEQFKLKSKLDVLKKTIKDVPEPAVEDVRAYYKAHPDKFMAPVQQRISVIILSVPPSSNNDTWNKARAQAKAIKEKIKEGKTFEEMAELYSSDISAEMGGDMGFIHQGMLGDAAQKVIDELKEGDISESVTLLEGIALLKLTKRVPGKLNTFERVQPQATKMLHEERSEKAWDDYIASLRKKADIVVHEELIKQSI